MTYKYGIAGDVGEVTIVSNSTNNSYEVTCDCSTGTVFDIAFIGNYSTAYLKDPINMVEGVEYTFLLRQPVYVNSGQYVYTVKYEAGYLFPAGTIKGNTSYAQISYGTNNWPEITASYEAVDMIRGTCHVNNEGVKVLHCSYDHNFVDHYTPEYGQYENYKGLFLDNASSNTQYIEANNGTDLDFGNDLTSQQDAAAYVNPFTVNLWIRPNGLGTGATTEVVLSKMGDVTLTESFCTDPNGSASQAVCEGGFCSYNWYTNQQDCQNGGGTWSTGTWYGPPDVVRKGYRITYDTTTKFIKMEITDGVTTVYRESSVELAAGTWYNVNFNYNGGYNGYNGGDLALMIDGTSDGSGSYQQADSYNYFYTSITNAGKFCIGRDEADALSGSPQTSYFNGQLDSISIYNTSFQEAIIYADTNYGQPNAGEGYTTDLRQVLPAERQQAMLAWYRFGDETPIEYIGTPAAPTGFDPEWYDYRYTYGQNNYVYWTPDAGVTTYSFEAGSSPYDYYIRDQNWNNIGLLTKVSTFGWAPSGSQCFEFYDYNTQNLLYDGVYDHSAKTITWYDTGTSGATLASTYTSAEGATWYAQIVVDEGFWRHKPRKHLTPVNLTNAGNLLEYNNDEYNVPKPPPPPYTNNYALRVGKWIDTPSIGTANLHYGHLPNGYAHPSHNNAFTVSFWFQKVEDTYGVDGDLLSVWHNTNGTGWSVYMDSDGKVHARIQDSATDYDVASSVISFNDINEEGEGNWHHVALMFNNYGDYLETSAYMKFYIDGIEQTTFSGGGANSVPNFSNNTGDFEVYGHGNSNYPYDSTNLPYGDMTLGVAGYQSSSFSGRFDDISYWNTVMSEAEILDLYNQGQPKDLVLHAQYGNNISRWFKCGDVAGPSYFDNYASMHDVINQQNIFYLAGGHYDQNGYYWVEEARPYYDPTDLPHWDDHKSLALGKHGQYSTYFDAAQSQFLEAANTTDLDFDGNSPFTVSFWVKPNFAQTNMLVTYGISKSMPGSPYTGWSVYWYGASLNFQAYGPGGYLQHYGTSPTPQGQWTHIACVYTNQTTMQVYADGVLQSFSNGGNTLTGSVFNNSEYFKIGNLPGYTGNNQSGAAFDGNIDEVSVWDKALSAQEVFDLYNSGHPTDLTSMTDLRHWWRMGDYTNDSLQGYGIWDVAATGNTSPVSALQNPVTGVTLVNNAQTMSDSLNLVLDSPSQGYEPYLEMAAPASTGTSVLFDVSQNQYIEASSSSYLDFDGLSPFSISAWVKPTSYTGPGSSAIIFGKSDGSPDWKGYALYFHTVVGGLYTKLGMAFRNDNYPSNRLILEASLGTGGPGGTAIIPTGQWSHVVIVFENQSTAYLYVDGVAITLTTVVANLTSSMSNTSVFQMGDGLGVGYPYDGQVDDTSVWDIALSLSEVQEIFNSGSPGDLSTHSQNAQLTNWWQMGHANDSFSNLGIYDSMAGTYLTDGSASMTNAVNLPVDSPAPSAALTLSTELDLSTPFTITFWAKQTYPVDLPNPREYFYSKMVDEALGGPGIQAYHYQGHLFFEFVSDQTSSDWAQLQCGSYYGVLADKKWHHIAIAYDVGGTDPVLFVDGQQDWSASLTGTNTPTPLANTLDKFMIGGRIDANQVVEGAFNGKIDEFAIWTGDNALTSAEVQKIYNDGNPTDLTYHSRYSDLLSWWRLGDAPDDLTPLTGRVIDTVLSSGNDLTPKDTDATKYCNDTPQSDTQTYTFEVNFDNWSYSGYCTTDGVGSTRSYMDCANAHGGGSGSDWSGYADSNAMYGYSNSYHYIANNTQVSILDVHGNVVEAVLTYDGQNNNDAYAEDEYGVQLNTNWNSNYVRGIKFGFSDNPNPYQYNNGQSLQIKADLPPGDYQIAVYCDTHYNQGGQQYYKAKVYVSDPQWNIIYPVSGTDCANLSNYASSSWYHTPAFDAYQGYPQGYLSPCLFLLSGESGLAMYPDDLNDPVVVHKFNIPDWNALNP
jgi:hypothetical protein